MRTYEGVMKIKWDKNGRIDGRPLTIDTKDRKTLRTELNQLKNDFINEDNAYSVTFDMDERI